MVKFCDKCGNLLNHTIKTSGEFAYYCRLCGHEDTVIEQCIEVNELNRSAYDYPLNPQMIHDVTLPRTRQVPCPECSTREGSKSGETEFPEVIIYQYNPDMLNVGYMCTRCLTHWKN